MRNVRPSLVLVAFALLLSLMACAPSGPGDLPGDLPVPPGSVTQDPWPAPAGFKQVTLKSSLGVVEVPRWYEKQLKAGKWRDATDGQTLFKQASDTGTGSTLEAMLTDGSRQVKVTATDEGPEGLQTLVIFEWADK